MQLRPTSPRWVLAAGLVAFGGLAGAARYAIGSDHQDTPFVELNPKTDLTDVYAFPGGSGRTVLAMDTRAFLTPAGATDPGQASFDDDLLYQFKIDTDDDAKEDKVIQVTFTGEGAAQQVEVHGPVAPTVRGAMENVVADVTPAVTGALSTVPTSRARRSSSGTPASTTPAASTSTRSRSSCPARRSRAKRPAGSGSGAPSVSDRPRGGESAPVISAACGRSTVACRLSAVRDTSMRP